MRNSFILRLLLIKLLTFGEIYCIIKKNLYRRGVLSVQKYVCNVCGYVYDPYEGDDANGIAPNTAFEDLPEDWVCPLCGVDKSNFSAE